MGFLSSVGGMVGGVVGGMFGGPIGAQIGSQVGAGLGGMLENLIGQHGQPNVQSAMNNNMMSSLVGQLGQAIQCAPGIPQFQRDQACQALQDIQQSYPPELTPPGCQRDTDDAMSGIIDKVVAKVVDRLMEMIQGGGGCESGGSIQDMVRQAIEDVVRDMIGGGAGDGGCSNNPGGASSGTSPSTGGTDYASQAGDTSDVRSSVTTSCGEDDQKTKPNSGSGSWLVALAKAMGEMTGDHLQKMMQAQDRMEDSKVDDADLKGKSEEEQSQIKQEKGKEFTQAQAEFQAESKLFAMCSEATSTVLKSVGEGLSSMARKQ
ncbi:MAG: hypothetical protein JAY99_11355 [Candidatus Thiodiazotropha lotti]|uniref:hypothetical protein n=1 Tax=Candidatus Thiodiazotropha endoloripes TaxID=1818881 RepID=UPI00083D867B|nr:hypothetical protein [Candidatus Thiodiazotropha endoloripes]MCG7992981.1 hypothetical protein [Candidatus Thiodiazotropha lotti]MCW4184644.1 hypothetical protein [Candidatus Thiodiazotropha weberae]MCG8000116.1 hypothetical protein [Candidatus Thiodiazotropha lotti]MCW4191886.1 hypothetical protein [Candidatus Thiodiazotropha weberae]ODB82666.1 hypothetical protein A3194_18015 [Candidatus Thiodiazotropha endoloripes]